MTAAIPTWPSRRQLSFRSLIAPARLRGTWAELRREFRRAPWRDPIDYLEIDLDLPIWISRINKRLASGTYRPAAPGRREVAKGSGAFRIITAPAIEDVLIFRHIADYIYRRAQPSEPEGAFFSPRFGRHAIGKKLDKLSDEDYVDFFEVWIRYDEYRALLGLSGLYKYIVVTDISNYFDSIQHALLLEYLAPYGVPREALGVLGQLLDVLRPSAGHSSAPAVGLPQDSFDCSSTLAHIYLFEHDGRAMKQVGRDAYVRWMDDQNLGVKDEVGSHRAINALVKSLNQQRLTLNTGKTKILTPAEQSEHLCLKHNKTATALFDKVEGGNRGPDERHEFDALWFAVIAEKRGNWHKVVKRLLRLAALLRSDRATLKNCKELLLEEPRLAERIYEYLIARGRFDDYLALFNWYLDSGHSLYEDVEALWFESLLVASPPFSAWPGIRAIALEFVRGTRRGTGLPGPKTPAALTLYWLGDRRQQTVFASLLSGVRVGDGQTRRTLAAILCALDPGRSDEWLLLAGRDASAHVSSLVQLVLKLRDGKSFFLPKELVFTRRPSLLDHFVLDARAWLRLELLTASPRLDVRTTVTDAIRRTKKRRSLLETERRIAGRIDIRVGAGKTATKAARAARRRS